MAEALEVDDAYTSRTLRSRNPSRSRKPPRQRNIVLTGFMGSGKTTVGAILADRLGLKFVDTDSVIESEHGPIKRIVSKKGWHIFRALERDVARELAGRSGLVISTGGRFMLDAVCAELIETGSDVVWLKADPSVIVHRVVTAPDADPAKRPLLIQEGRTPLQIVESMLAKRADLYGKYPAVETTDRTPEEVADAVLTLLAQ